MISGAGLCWQHVGGVGSTTTTTLVDACELKDINFLNSEGLRVV